MQLVKTRRDKPPDSSRKPPIKIDHEVVVADDELKTSDQVEFFKGDQARLYTMGTACLIWKRRETQGKSLDNIC